MKFRRKRLVVTAATLVVLCTLGLAFYQIGYTPRPGADIDFSFTEGCDDIFAIAKSSDQRWAITVSANIFKLSENQQTIAIDLSEAKHPTRIRLLEAFTTFENQNFCVAHGPNVARHIRFWTAYDGKVAIDIPDPPARPHLHEPYFATISLTDLRFRLEDSIVPITTSIDDITLQCFGFGWLPE